MPGNKYGYARCSPKHHERRVTGRTRPRIALEAVGFVMEAGEIDSRHREALHGFLEQSVGVYYQIGGLGDVKRPSPSQREADWSRICNAARDVLKLLKEPHLRNSMIATQMVKNAYDAACKCNEVTGIAAIEAAQKQVDGEIASATGPLALLLDRARAEKKRKNGRGSRSNFALKELSLHIVSFWSAYLRRQDDDPNLFHFAKEIFALVGKDSSEPRTISNRLGLILDARREVKEKLRESF